MTSNSDTRYPNRVYVWTWLPRTTEAVVAGVAEVSRGRMRFGYGRSYLARPDAISLYGPELPLREGWIEPAGALVMPGCLRDGSPDAWGRRVIESRTRSDEKPRPTAHYGADMESIRERLRCLPAFPADLPELDPDAAPERPEELFLGWLDEAIASGARQPHAMTVATARPDGSPVARTLILKDLDERGYHFSTHRTSRKGDQLSRNPRASLLFFWRESGRQVRVTGTVAELGYEESQADWSARPSYDGTPNPEWQVYVLQPDEYEFLQAREDRRHTRLAYLRTEMGWSSARVTTPGG